MISATINNLIADLKPRQKEIIVSRFGLENANRETLAGLGEKYNITRERVRQIEAEALRKIKEEAEKERLNAALRHIFSHLNNFGGLRREDFLVKELQLTLKDNDLHSWHLRFLGEVASEPYYYFEDENFHSFWHLGEKILRNLNNFLGNLEHSILGKEEEIIADGKFKDYLYKAMKASRVSEPVALNFISVSRRFKTNPFGDVGLSDWEEINPKTMSSKTYLILKKERKPLHFREIADLINKSGFDGKKALPQTVHNELIKDPRFVLVGRGIYALKENGYIPGTARHIISHILKKEGPKNVEELMDALKKQRILERNTVVLNLQNKDLFRKLPDGRYRIAR